MRLSLRGVEGRIPVHVPCLTEGVRVPEERGSFALESKPLSWAQRRQRDHLAVLHILSEVRAQLANITTHCPTYRAAVF